MGFFRLNLAVCLAVLIAGASGTETPLSLDGVIRDATGATIGGAEIWVEGRRLALSGADGRFTIEVGASLPAQLRVKAEGFATADVKVPRHDLDSGQVEIVLKAAGANSLITVTATRAGMELQDTPASVDVISRRDLDTSAAVALDDALLQVPGFALFRRTDSLTANPGSQGVALRGLGGTGVSRALVLADGIPLNDPFAGNVVWSRIPSVATERVEVLQGGSSDLYGSDALGGVIQIFARQPTSSLITLETSYGNRTTADGAMMASLQHGPWGATLTGDVLHTDGYILVPKDQRGTADAPANSEHQNGMLNLTYRLRNGGRAFVEGEMFDEDRQNGTLLQTNSTHFRQLAVGTESNTSWGAFRVRLYGGSQWLHQSYSAVALDRDSESLTKTQVIPAQQLGASVQWVRSLGQRHTLVGGVEARDIRGHNDELKYANAVATGSADTGGRDQTAGFFLQDSIRLGSRIVVTAAGRFDYWQNVDGAKFQTPFSTNVTTKTALPDRNESAFDPRLGVVYKLTQNLSLSASGYRSFRAPTLHELYRDFRVGNANTLSNPYLRAERLTGGEGGARYVALRERLALSGNFFWNDVARPVANVTLSTTPALITRQRENLGRIRSRGVELEAEARLSGHWSVVAGYQFADSTVLEFQTNPAMVGLDLPQQARHQFSFRTAYSRQAWSFGVQGRAIGRQYDDDLNLYALAPYFNLDAWASRSLGRHAEAFIAVQNVLNQQFEAGKTPVTTLGPPILARVGIRLKYGE
jgi:outer membrane receptor protein involved in Fe transport